MRHLLYIDLFCGAGGTSTGVELAKLHGQKCAKVIACVNHDQNAIASHLANHPEAVHFTEDVRTLDLTPLVAQTEKMKKQYPDALLVLWASLECTNFSRAKGGQPRDADSRTLAEHLFRYIEELKPDYILIENVEEFMCWGELDEKGKPVSRDKGTAYLRWCNTIENYGYSFRYRLLNAADFGAYTSRKRFFGQFAKKGLPHSFPVPTHSKEGSNDKNLTIFNVKLNKWKPVRDVLDLADEGESIFTRRQPLCDRTLERIYAGLVKFVAGTTRKQFDAFLIKYNSMSQRGKYVAPGINEPCPTVAVQNRLGIVKVCFLSKQFSGNPDSKNQSIDKPAGTITTIDHHAFVTAYYGNGQFLVNPQFDSNGSSIDNPCFTLIARMDKMPPYLITTKTGEKAIVIYETDTPIMVKIKQFMALYQIIDIKMRMLKVNELKKIMGFPADYVLIGNQAEQKKFIGNAVEVNMSRALCEALAEAN